MNFSTPRNGFKSHATKSVHLLFQPVIFPGMTDGAYMHCLCTEMRAKFNSLESLVKMENDTFTVTFVDSLRNGCLCVDVNRKTPKVCTAPFCTSWLGSAPRGLALSGKMEEFQDFARFCKVLRGFARFCKVLQGFCKVLQGFRKRFRKVLQGFSGCFRYIKSRHFLISGCLLIRLETIFI